VVATQIFFWELFTPKLWGNDSQFDGIINFSIGLVKNHQRKVADFLETFSWMGGLGGDPKNKMFRDAKCAFVDFCFYPKVSGNVLPNEKPNISHFTSI